VKLPIYFISDIHLNINGKYFDKEKRINLSNFFQHIIDNNGTLFIVGDLFDYWFEYKYFIPKNYFDILFKINEMKTKGIKINFIPGNHDYWIKNFGYDELFSNIYPNGAKIMINGKKIFVSHGDGILKNDYVYRFLKTILRNKFFIFTFSLIHPDLGYNIAKKFSKKNFIKPVNQNKINSLKEKLTSFSNDKINDGFDYVILGHYHLKDEINIKKSKLILLGDWIKWKSYAIFDGKKLELKEWQ